MGRYSRLGFGFPVRSEHSFNHTDTGHGAAPRESWKDVFARRQGVTPVPQPDSSDFYDRRGRHISSDDEIALLAPRRAYEACVEELLANFGGWQIVTGGMDKSEFFVIGLDPPFNEDGIWSFSPLPDLTIPDGLLEKLWRFCAAMNIDCETPAWIVIHTEYMD